MDSKIKNIIFDWGGVLIDLDKTKSRDAFRQLGIKDDETTSFHLKKIMFDYEIGNIDTAEFRNRLRKFADSGTCDSDIDNAWNSMLLTVPTKKLELLLELKARFNLFLLSNTNSMHWEYASEKVFRYKENKLSDFFKKIFLSYKMHCAKPDIEIFRKAISEAGVVAEECLFIDDLKENCEAAKAAGLKAIVYVPGEDLELIFK